MMTDRDSMFKTEIEGIGKNFNKKEIIERDKENSETIKEWNERRKEEGSKLRINNGASKFEMFLTIIFILGLLTGIGYGLYLIQEGKLQSNNMNSCPEIPSCPAYPNQTYNIYLNST